MDSLVTKTKRKDVRKALDTLPPELDESYEQTMERIKGQGKDYSELAMRVLLWVSNTVRPLSPVELQYAIAVQPGMTELDDEDLDEQDLMISVCAGLVVLDAETNTLRLVRKFSPIRSPDRCHARPDRPAGVIYCSFLYEDVIPLCALLIAESVALARLGSFYLFYFYE